MPSAASACAKLTMNGLRWPAPAPCARITVAPLAGPAVYTSAEVAVLAATSTRISLGFFTRVADLCVGLEIVGHRKHPELRRQRSRQHSIHVAVDDAGQRHVPIVDDDVNWRIRHRRIGPEVRVAVDRARDTVPQLVIEPRHRQHGELVVHLAYA